MQAEGLLWEGSPDADYAIHTVALKPTKDGEPEALAPGVKAGTTSLRALTLPARRLLLLLTVAIWCA